MVNYIIVLKLFIAQKAYYLKVAENRMKVIIIFLSLFFLLNSISGLQNIKFSRYLNAIMGFDT